MPACRARLHRDSRLGGGSCETEGKWAEEPEATAPPSVPTAGGPPAECRQRVLRPQRPRAAGLPPHRRCGFGPGPRASLRRRACPTTCRGRAEGRAHRFRLIRRPRGDIGRGAIPPLRAYRDFDDALPPQVGTGRRNAARHVVRVTPHRSERHNRELKRWRSDAPGSFARRRKNSPGRRSVKASREPGSAHQATNPTERLRRMRTSKKFTSLSVADGRKVHGQAALRIRLRSRRC